MNPAQDVSLKRVSRFEANLLRILHFFLRRDPAAHALPLVFSQCPQPDCLSRQAVELIQDTLTKGCTALLARSSGWRREHHLRSGKVVEGRLWQRTPPADLGLSFSPHTLRFLLWITAQNPAENKKSWPTPPVTQLTTGDLLLLYFAYGELRTTEAAAIMRSRALFATHGLCRLAYPEDFTSAEAAPAFPPWTVGVGACILEALQEELARRWLDVERRKLDIGDWQLMRALGQSQQRVLDAFLEALETAGRQDLARFLLVTLARLLPASATADAWLGGLHTVAPRLAERTETQRAALALLRQLERLRQWERQARGVAFFEEHYAASQLWKADWERWQGETLCGRAQAILRTAEPL